MDIAGLINKARNLAGENSTTILTGMGVSGTLATAYLTGRASYKAAQFIDRENDRRRHLPDGNNNPDDGLTDLTTKEIIKMIWPLYIPAASTCATTITSIIMANQIASKKLTALAVASGISERAFQEYKAKVVEQLGEKKDVTIREAIAQNKVDQHPINTREIILAGTGEVLCFDVTTGRYFQSTVEEIKKAANTVNFNIVSHGYASLSEFYDEIGLAPTGYSDDVGWNLDSQLEVLFSTTMSSDGRPCIAVDFSRNPLPNYSRIG